MSRFHSLRCRTARSSGLASSYPAVYPSNDYQGFDSSLDFTVDEPRVSGPVSLGANVGATTLISAGLLIITIWSVSLLAKREPAISISEAAPASNIMVAARPDTGNMQLPSSSTRVLGGELGLYHWNKDCPLANARSLKPGRHNQGSHRKQVYMTRLDAELRGLRPCNYCGEIEFWRGRKPNAADSVPEPDHR